jgi:hypothetical protein
MAILTKGIFGPISGKLGNLVFCICVNGTNYVRTRPNKTKKPPSMAQLAHRKKFGIASKFLHPLNDILKKGFKATKKGTTPMGLAMGAMLSSGIIGDGPDFRIDFPRVQLSRGSLLPLLDLNIKQMGRNVIMLEWECQVNPFNSFQDDVLQFIAYNVTKETFAFGDEAYREDEVLTFRLPSASPGDRLVFYVFMETRSGNTCAQFGGEMMLAKT